MKSDISAMSISYQYTDAVVYIGQLKFDYIGTYSLQRGAAYDAQYRKQSEEYMQLSTRKTNGEVLFPDEEATFQELLPFVGRTQYVIDGNGAFHPSCNKINTFRHDDKNVHWLRQILRTPVVERPLFLCAPVYRDAIVFYDVAGNIVSSLNVCLECMYMETAPFHHLNGDYETYDLLKRFFIAIGHEVENPDRFIMDEINKHRLKNKQR